MWGWYRGLARRWQLVIGVAAALAVALPLSSEDAEPSDAVTTAADGGDVADQLPFAPTTATTEPTVSTELPPPPTTTTTVAPPPPTTVAPQPVVAEAPPASPDCHPSYDPCLPDGPDLDCGDIGHPVRVIGPDEYRLDADGDGVGCERS